MINKVLIAEDHESANISLRVSLEELSIKDVHYVYYCDDALQKIKNGINAGDPFDLLITDLYFEEDGIPQSINSGTDLIKASKQVQPELKILVFSAENKIAVIEPLFSLLEIDGYVRKARNDAKELRLAMECLNQNQRYFPRHLQQLINQKNTHEFTEYDITIISLLAQGMRQKNISKYLQENQIKPAGLSSIEKRLAHIKEVFEFNNNEQLVAFCKDMGII